MQDAQNLPWRTLKTSSLLTPILALLLYGSQPARAWGFAIGGFLSIFSLATIACVVPMLFQTGAPRYVRALLNLTLLMKLPIFGVGLYLATNVRGIDPAFTAIGAGLVPAVLTLKALGNQLAERVNQTALPITPKPERVRKHARYTIAQTDAS
jgi:hypothetical protein